MVTSGVFFNSHGVRGIVHQKPLTLEAVARFGTALGQVLGASEQASVVIARDTRESGKTLEDAIVSGITAAGANVGLLGVLPTPSLAKLTMVTEASVGVMITASHNPPEYNGLKLYGADGNWVDRDFEQRVEARMDFAGSGRSGSKTRCGGRITSCDYAAAFALTLLEKRWPNKLSLADLKVVLDCANGAAFQIGPQLLSDLGASVYPLGVNPNGMNINVNCGALSLVAARNELMRTGAHIAIVLDGDGDRVVILDEHGRAYDGDDIVAAIATSWSRLGIMRGSVVVAESSNSALVNYLKSIGISTRIAPVGDRWLWQLLLSEHHCLGAEKNGHFMMPSLWPASDGLVAALQVLREMVDTGQHASQICHRFDQLPQFGGSVALRTVADVDISSIRRAIADTERAVTSKGGRVFIRHATTEPLLRFFVECSDEAFAEQAASAVENELKAYRDSMA